LRRLPGRSAAGGCNESLLVQAPEQGFGWPEGSDDARDASEQHGQRAGSHGITCATRINRASRAIRTACAISATRAAQPGDG